MPLIYILLKILKPLKTKKMYIYNSKEAKITQICKSILGIFLLLSIFYQQPTFAQNTNTENDCGIDLSTTAITPDSKILDYGIINSNDILAIYNNLQKICKGNQNQDGTTEKSYIIQMYKLVVKYKFMLANKDYTSNSNFPIIPDTNAKKWYDQKIKYYKDNKGLNPEQLKSDFDDIRKYGVYNNNINPNNCVYKADNTKGLYNKLYNLCDMISCMRDKIKTKYTDANVIEFDNNSCKVYIDDVISKELDHEQDIITKYATRMTNSNFDTYINKYIGFRMTNMQEVIDKIDGYMNFLLKKITKFTKNCMG